MASEVGALEIAPERIVAKGRLEPGKMFLVDLRQGRILGDHELKHALASAHPYGQWLREKMVPLADLPPAPLVPGPDHDTLLQRQIAFGYTIEDLKYIVGPMGANGEEALGSMGTDTPLAVLSDRAAPLQLLQAAICPGDESSAGRDPRRAGHLGIHRRRRRGKLARTDRGKLPADRARAADPR